jgi:hypothetical protein
MKRENGKPALPGFPAGCGKTTPRAPIGIFWATAKVIKDRPSEKVKALADPLRISNCGLEKGKPRDAKGRPQRTDWEGGKGKKGKNPKSAIENAQWTG